MEQIKGGIVTDNYKVEKFKKELTKAGFTNFEVNPFKPGYSVIYVWMLTEEKKELAKVCKTVELHFKFGN